MHTLRVIGYWRSEEHPEFPDPHDLVDTSWDDAEKRQVSWYLSQGTLARLYMGSSRCRICGQMNGAMEYSDDTYTWPEGLAHYISDHSVRLPDEVVRHAIERNRQYQDAGRDAGWWLSVTRPTHELGAS
ncbi:hypothetical protein ACIBPB_02795 [Micromonospora sp. NPDC049836]|uniref:hypothetical protein n=1 Tax=Micromonospora sp. NPDC049836 TaxID=3364274 RepID=UPI0037997B74